jgi:hypothetical protein
MDFIYQQFTIVAANCNFFVRLRDRWGAASMQRGMACARRSF